MENNSSGNFAVLPIIVWTQPEMTWVQATQVFRARDYFFLSYLSVKNSLYFSGSHSFVNQRLTGSSLKIIPDSIQTP